VGEAGGGIARLGPLAALAGWPRRVARTLKGRIAALSRFTPSSTTEQDRRGARRWTIVLGIVFIAAAGWRLTGITIWPVAYDDMLQYENAVSTRRLYMSWRATPPSMAEAAWLAAASNLRRKAPPLMEALLASVWLMSGRERPWLAGLLTSGLWLLAGALLYVTCLRLVRDRAGPVVAAAWFLLTPFGVLISRVFQHEAALMAGTTWALYRLTAPETLKHWRRTLVGGVLAGLGLALKPGLGLPLLFGATIGIVSSRGNREVMTLFRGLLFLVLAALPSLVYAALFLGGETHQLIPRLLLSPTMYAGWASLIDLVVGPIPLLLGLLGGWLHMRRTGSLLLPGLFAGYVAQCIVFSYATATHSYYHLPLMVPVALGLCVLSTQVTEFAERRGVGTTVERGSVAILATYVLLAPLPLRQAFVDRSGERRDAALATIGRDLGTGTRVLGLDRGYGFPLSYHGLIVQYWPSSADLGYENLRSGVVVRRKQRLQQAIDSFRPDYFVLTKPEELRTQRGLEDFFEDRFFVTRKDPAQGVWIFDLRSVGR